METPRPTREEIAELQKHVGYGSAWLGPVLTGGQGSRVTDIEGRSYIDCTAQAWTLEEAQLQLALHPRDA